MPFELDIGYELSLQLDLLPDLQRLQANQSTIPLLGPIFVKWLQCILGVAWDEARNVQDNQMAIANKSWCPINPSITACAKVLIDTQDLLITYGNVNSLQRYLVHHYIGRYEIFQLPTHHVELHLLHDMTI